MGIHKPSRGRRIMFKIGISIKLRKILFDCQHIRSQHKSLITVVTRTKAAVSAYLRHRDLCNLLSIPGNSNFRISGQDLPPGPHTYLPTFISDENTSEPQSLM